MSKPVISTITPCFKMKPYLKLFLEELPKQTIFDQIEVVMDHNEPDEEELEWVREFQSKYPGRLKHIVTNPVKPIGTSMNRCIKEASADLLTIWNIDDLRTDNSLELMVRAFEAGADIVYGNFEVVRKFGVKSGSLTDFSKYQSQPEEFTRSMLLGPFMAFRKSLVEKAGYFDEQLKSGADFDLAVRLAFHGKPFMAEGLLGYYLNEGKGVSTRPNSRQPLERTVIEFRYGIYDRMDYDHAVAAAEYDIFNVVMDNTKVPIATYVPKYEHFKKERYERWHEKGLRRYALRKVFKYKEIYNFLKQIYKKVFLRV